MHGTQACSRSRSLASRFTHAFRSPSLHHADDCSRSPRLQTPIQPKSARTHTWALCSATDGTCMRYGRSQDFNLSPAIPKESAPFPGTQKLVFPKSNSSRDRRTATCAQLTHTGGNSSELTRAETLKGGSTISAHC